MKVNELMIGDWVLQDGFEYKVVMLRECDIRNEYPIAVDSIVHGYTYCPSDAIQPIPLTAEILEKNGFERKAISDKDPYYQDEEGNSYYQYGELGINTPHIWFWYIDGHITMPSNCTKWLEFSSVHELQHALRLCGLNDLADNFKV